MAITIRDVAREAGVSPATVSRVFNDDSLVQAATRARILAAAKKLRYVPNATARSLSLRKTQTLGFIVPEPHREFFSEVIRGIDETAHQHGYALIISSTHNRRQQLRSALAAMNGRVDGLLVLSPIYTAADLADELPARLPTTFLLSNTDGTASTGFVTDNVQGARDAVAYLVSMGHRRIALLRGQTENRDTRDRQQGYTEALAAAGIAFDPALVVEGDYSQASGYEAARHLLRLPTDATALFAMNDYMALGAVGAFQEQGVRVPEDVSVVGFDDILSARYANPALTTVRVPAFELSRRATEYLLGLVADGDGARARAIAGQTVVVPTELVVRRSAGPAVRQPQPAEQ